jgi:hypothetical protein
MAVAIQSYQRRQERESGRQEESSIDKLLKGLAVANQVTGIYSNVQQAQAYKQKTAEAEAASKSSAEAEARGREGKMTEPEYQKTLEGQRFVEIRQKEGEELPTGVLQRKVIGPGGQERSVLLRQVSPVQMEQRQAEQTQKAETVSAKADALATKKEAATASKQTVLQQKASASSAKEKARQSERSLKNVSDLRKEYSNNPLTKDTQNIAASWERVQGGFEEPSAAGDLNLIFGYMKMLDPGSTVREGEFANAQNSGSVPERIQAQYNKLQSGERLTPQQRKDFFNQAQNVIKGQFRRQGELDAEFKRIAQRNGWDDQQLIFVKPPQFKGGQQQPERGLQPPQQQQTPARQPIRNSMIRGPGQRIKVTSAGELPDL